jgi:hypothetical protein
MFDLSMLKILYLHSNCFVCLTDEIGHLKNLQVSTDPVSSMKCVNTSEEFGRDCILK